MLAHEAGQPLVGDDVTALQTQLIELGFPLARADGIFGLVDRDGAARASSASTA